METNRIEFTGTIERLKSVTTKTGTSMATLLLKVGHDKFKCVAFKNVADALLGCSDEDQVSVIGSGSINSWKDNQDHWHNDFQLSVWKCEIDGQVIEYKKRPGTGDQGGNSRGNEPPLPPEPDQPVGDQRSEFDHKGGPF